MSNIAVRKENESKPATTQTQSWDPFRSEPFRMMRDLMGWDPFRTMSPFTTQAASTFAPSFEVKETKEAYLFKADVPGVKEADVDVTITGNRLSISGKREAERQEKTDTFYTYERSYGDFTRSFTMPEGIDSSAVRAEMKDGVLTVSVPKKPEAQPKKIPLESAAKKS